MIKCTKIGSTNIEVFKSFSTGQLEYIAVDPYSRNLYWIDSLGRYGVATKLSHSQYSCFFCSISVAMIDDPQSSFDLFTGLQMIRGLAIDYVRG